MIKVFGICICMDVGACTDDDAGRHGCVGYWACVCWMG